MNRPPKRQSSLNINFRQLSDSQADDDISIDSNCDICRETSDRVSPETNLSGLVRRLFNSYLTQAQLENLKYCLRCRSTLTKLEVAEKEFDSLKSSIVNLLTTSQEEQSDSAEPTSSRCNEKNFSRNFSCLPCGQHFEGKSNFDDHTKISHASHEAGLTCSICRQQFPNQETLIQHLATHTEDSSKSDKPSFVCSTCGKVFTRKAYLLEHQARHKGIKDRECQLCQKKFYNTSYWRHMSTVHSQDARLLYTCPTCDRKFTQHFLLRAHQQTHQPYDERPFACDQCNDEKRFPTKLRLQAHLKQVHGGIKGDSADVKLCPDCGAICQSSAAYAAHRRSHHESKVDKASSNLQCSECSLVFSSKLMLRRHVQDIHMPSIESAPESVWPTTDSVILQVDSNDFLQDMTSSLSAVLTQSSNIDSNQKPTLISGTAQQAISFQPSSSTLRPFQVFSMQSMDAGDDTNNSISTNDIRFQQQQSNVQVFQEPKNFLALKASAPDPRIKSCSSVRAKSFQCSTCNKSFRLGKDLKRHLRTHTGEKPYKCSDCVKCFASSSNLSEHRTIHTGVKNYLCLKCSQRFRLWTTWKKHTLRCKGDGVNSTDTNSISNEFSQTGFVPFQTDQMVLSDVPAIYILDQTEPGFLQ